MEENELEEGEACSIQEDDASINPDIDLSYIDEKIQHVLGHFQKDFEGGVSAENLGAKFGGYGSFLPAYQRSPSIWSHPRSPNRVPNHNVPTSPQNPPIEVANQNCPVANSASVPIRSCSIIKAPTLDGTRKNGACISIPVLREDTPLDDMACTTFRSSNKNVLKVRIKVGSDSVLQRPNASIYSDMGLEYSPSLSPEDSPGTSAGSSPELPEESPMTVYQIMTSFPVLGGHAISPLSETLLHLMENEIPDQGDDKFSVHDACMETCSTFFVDSASSRDVKCSSGRKARSLEKSVKSSEMRTVNDASEVRKKEVDVQTPAVGGSVSNVLDVADEKIERQLSSEIMKSGSIQQEPHTISPVVRNISPGFTKDESSVGMVSSDPRKVLNQGNFCQPLKAKAYKTASADVAVEEGKTNKSKYGLSYLHMEHGVKSNKNCNVFKLESDGSRAMKGPIVEAEESKVNTFQESSLHEHNSEQALQHKDHSPGATEKPGYQVNSMPPLELPKETKAVSSISIKEKKKICTSKTDRTENKQNSWAHKEPPGIYGQECDKNAVGELKSEHVGKRTDTLEITLKEKSRDSRIEHENSSSPFTEKTNGRKVQNQLVPEACGKNTEITPLLTNGLASDAASAPAAPVVIEEHWVACDRCQKWRLLPYGTNPDHLPKKWLCTMLNWLPGMNKCSISEEETTRALHALYQAPLPENHSTNGPNIPLMISTDTHHFDKIHDPGLDIDFSFGKKKHIQKDASHTLSHLAHISHTVKKPHQASVKSKSLDDVNQVASFPSNRSPFQHLSKSNDLHVKNDCDRQKEKVRMEDLYVDGGKFPEQNGKPLKSKGKRDFDQDAFKISKKVKGEGTVGADEDWLSDHDLSGKVASSSNNGLPPKVLKKASLNGNANLSRNSKCSSQDSLSGSRKKSRQHLKVPSNGYDTFDVENFGKESGVRKRKVKEHQHGHTLMKALIGNSLNGDDRANNVREEISESESRKEKRSRVSRPEGRESVLNKVEERIDKNGRSTRILLPNFREHALDRMEDENKEAADNEQKGLRNLDSLDTLKKDLPYAQPSTAATSSSSKVSGTHKSKSNFQEARGSPVESVSSSPLRILNIDKVPSKKNQDDKDCAIAHCASLDVCQDTEDGHMSVGEGKSVMRSMAHNNMYNDAHLSALGAAEGTSRPSQPSQRKCHDGFYGNARGHNEGKVNNPSKSCGSTPHKSNKNSSHLREKQKNPKADANKGKAKASDSFGERDDIHSSKKGNGSRHETVVDPHHRSFSSHEGMNDMHHRLDKDTKRRESLSLGRQSTEGRRDSHMNFGTHENVEASRLLSKQQKDKHLKDNEVRTVTTIGVKAYHEDNHLQGTSQENAKSSHILEDRTEKSEAACGRGKSQLSLHPGDKTEVPNRDRMVLPVMKRDRIEAPSAVAVTGEPSKTHKRPGKPDSQNGSHNNRMRQPTPNGVDAPSPFVILREARDLKHTANRMKNEGLEKESTGLYFEAALKFLHVAFLLENSSYEGGKHGDTIQSIPMYSDTGRLCEFVAHEYEKLKDMAAAALAYKCMEVAYMKVIFSKHSCACKDRRELHTALLVPTGESPSSSASDVDNLNNQNTMEKATSAKGLNSPQVAVNHVIVAHNRPHFMRLLNFVQDVNFAMEASRKSQNAFNSANANQEGLHHGPEIIASVRRVIDHTFHDVEGLMHLVRLSINSISH